MKSLIDSIFSSTSSNKLYRNGKFQREIKNHPIRCNCRKCYPIKKRLHLFKESLLDEVLNELSNSQTVKAVKYNVPVVSRGNTLDAPKLVTDSEMSLLKMEVARNPTLASVATHWRNSCEGGDVKSNNCAHYLSDAFIRAGYTDLLSSASQITARCRLAGRPIRAREMWRWFQSKAVRTSRTVQRNTGWWAVFQLNEREYWGGHVSLLDSNNWVYYGTGWFQDWDQYCYQW